MTANRHRGEVAFKYFEGQPGCELVPKGLYLRYRTGDLAKLHATYGDAYKARIANGLNDGIPGIVLDCLRLGLKKPDGTVFTLVDDLADDLPFALSEVFDAIWTALCLALHGKTPAELAEVMAKVQSEIMGAANAAGFSPPPQMSSGGSSTRSPEQEPYQTL